MPMPQRIAIVLLVMGLMSIALSFINIVASLVALVLAWVCLLVMAILQVREDRRTAAKGQP